MDMTIAGLANVIQSCIALALLAILVNMAVSQHLRLKRWKKRQRGHDALP